MSLRNRLTLTGDPLYLIDGSAFVYRGYYAFQNMARSDGFPTNALYIVTRIILKLLREERPTHVGFILDGKGKSFRHDLFDAYKAQRSATPEPLIAQLAPIMELLKLLGVPLIVADGYEADDYIASLAYKFSSQQPVVIVGADKDLRQCLSQDVVMWDPSMKDEKIITLEDFQRDTGMQPSSWPDYQALIGDSSDNIPGVPQVGPKTALQIMHEYPCLEDLFAKLDSLPAKLQKRFAGMREQCFLYRELTRLRTDLCQDVELNDLSITAPDMTQVMDFLAVYELRSLAREVSSMSRAGIFGNESSAVETAVPVVEPVRPGVESLPLFAGTATSPSPKETIAAGMQEASAAVQATLFEALPTKVVFTALSALNELPSIAHTCALLQHEDGILLASADWQRLYTGSIELLVDLLEQQNCVLVGADIKSLCSHFPALWKLPIDRWFDLSLAAYLMSPEERQYDFTHLARRFSDFCGSVVDVTSAPGLFALDLYAFLVERIQGLSLKSVLSAVEIPLIPVLDHMQQRGITLDKEAFSVFLHEVQTTLQQLTKQIYTAAGKEFNIRSSQQLADILFYELNLPKVGKTKGGASSTSQEALEKLQGKHTIIDSLLQYRKMEKLRSTYLEPLPKLTDASGRIHTTFNQMATATGRLSSSNPNLQNIPVRGELGGRMRSCFVAAPGKVLVCADYSQIELRVLAHLSQDPTLLEAFRNNIDIHSRTAGLLYDTPLEQVTTEQRRNAKTINFGLIYGMGAQKLAKELQISLKEAKTFMERYFARFQRLKDFYDQVEEEARELGYVCTMAGRRRLTPDLASHNNQLRSQARRQAINTRVQGSAADIIKLAMIQVENDSHLASLGGQLLLQIHDELLMEVSPDTAEELKQRLMYLMEHVAPGGETLSVPLLVDAGVGANWAQAH